MSIGRERLAEAIDELAIAVDRDELVAVLRERDRLDARIAAAIGAFDAAELWDLDGGHVVFDWDRTAELAGRFALGFGLRLTDVVGAGPTFRGHRTQVGFVDVSWKLPFSS